MGNPVLLFDGVCNLCNWSVRFVLKHESDNQIRFASLQSQAGQQILKNYNIAQREPDSIVFIAEGKVYTKSAAVLEISRRLRNPWFIISRFYFLPGSFLNFIYDLIARNRYTVFGRKESCMIPDQKWKSRFLD